MNTKIKTIFATILTILILGIIISTGPANAINISISIPQTTSQYEEEISFISTINIENTELVPITNITAKIKDSSNNIIALCSFDIEGNKLSNCDSSFTDIQLLTNNTISDYGQLNVDSFNFGYGYGYGITEDTPSTIDLQYNITWQTPTIQSTQNSYTIEIELNANHLTNLFTKETQSTQVIDVAMEKPTVSLNKDYYEIIAGKNLTITASSNDPNGYNITTYKLYRQTTLLKQQSSPTFTFTPKTGENTYSIIAINEIGIESLPFEFEVNATSDLQTQSLNLEVNPTIKNSKISYTITTNTDFNNKKVKIIPQIECLDITFDYTQSYAEILTLKQEGQTFDLQLNTKDFDLQIPVDNDCTLTLNILSLETDEQTTLEDDVTFTYYTYQSTQDEQVTLNNGVDLVGYISSAFNKQFTTGFNSIDFNFRNTGSQDIEAEIQITIPDLNANYYQNINIPSNSQREVNIPIYINADTEPKQYPVRISYRINNGDLKVKYGYLFIQE